MSEIGYYYFWKWADNDARGRPDEVYAHLLRGHRHPAIRKFDARRLIQQLDRAAEEGSAVGEEWEWQRLNDETPRSASAIFVTCPRINASEHMAQTFSERFGGLGLSGYDESTGHVIPCFLPKLNCFITGQLPDERHYDITPEELPFLIRRIDPRRKNAFGIIEDRRNYFVQCYAEGRRYVVEWAQNQYRPVEIYDQWRAQDPERLAALGGSYSGEKIDENVVPDLMRYTDTLRIFSAFVRREPRPAKYIWRNVNHLIPNVGSDGRVKS